MANILLSPLVVAVQLTQYAKYQEGKDSREFSNIETLGFCTGLLSALAVSCSRNLEELEKYGAVAIRLAMLIGAVVDAQDAMSEHGPSGSIAASWTSPGAISDLAAVLKAFPDVSIPSNQRGLWRS